MRNMNFDKREFKKQVKENVKLLYRKNFEEANSQEVYQAVALAVKDDIIDNWLATQKVMEEKDPKIVYYMSMEFLMGRALGNNLINLCEYDEVKEALDELGFDIDASKIRSRIPRWETAAWGDWQPAFWILLLLWDIPLTAAVSVTVTACSSRKLRTVSRRKCRTTG